MISNTQKAASVSNPDTLAAELLSPGSIGADVQTDNTPPADYTGTTSEDWYNYLYKLHGWGIRSTAPKIPGYTAPPAVIIYARTGTYWSVETRLQGAVSALAASPYTRDWTDARVSAFLFDVANDAASFLGFSDPGTGNIPALVAQYVAVYRVAVTPV